MSRYVIVGAGALGASLAAQLTESGIRVLLVGRPAQVTVIRERGLRYVRPAHETVLRPEVATADEIVALEPDDILVVTPKSQDLDATLDEWAWRPVSDGRVVADLPVITVQNGLEAEVRALRRFRTVLGASFNLPARYTEPGVIEVRSSPTVAVVTIGAYPAGPSPLADQIAEEWNRAGYVVEVTEDVTRWKAAKLLFNVKNAVDVFAGTPDEVAALQSELIAEARHVLTGAGVDIADPQERQVDTSGFVVAPAAPGRATGMSTWQSFAREGTRGQEGDYLNGEIVLRARQSGIAAPLNEALQRLLGSSFRDGEAPGTRQVTEVRALGERLRSV